MKSSPILGTKRRMTNVRSATPTSFVVAVVLARSEAGLDAHTHHGRAADNRRLSLGQTHSDPSTFRSPAASA